MAVLENKWDGIKKALTLAVQLISDFGFNGQNLSANNAVLPIAYYLYMRNPSTYMTSSQFRQDRTGDSWVVNPKLVKRRMGRFFRCSAYRSQASYQGEWLPQRFSCRADSRSIDTTR